MDQPHANGASPAELPQPERQPEQPNKGAEYVVPFPGQPETQLLHGEHITHTQASSAVAAAISGAAHLPVDDSATPAIIPLIDPSQQANPTLADDVDVIEKEWVEKAKDIVAKTKTDPHQQSVELTNFRHDYMKKRYGKEIKLPDDGSA